MDLLKNLIVNLSADGPVAALCIVALCITAVGIWGEGPLANTALAILTVVAGGILFRASR